MDSRSNPARAIWNVARVTGLEPATSGVTGRRSNRLSYTRVFWRARHLGGRLGSVNHGRLHFPFLVFGLFVGVAGMGQSTVLEQESGDVRSACGGEDRLQN